MPIDVVVRLKDGSSKWYNIPLRIMRGNKGKDLYKSETTLLEKLVSLSCHLLLGPLGLLVLASFFYLFRSSAFSTALVLLFAEKLACLLLILLTISLPT